MTDVLLLYVITVLLLGWSWIIVFLAWVVGVVCCAMAWGGIVAGLSVLRRAVRHGR
jgi:hypothetical protein